MQSYGETRETSIGTFSLMFCLDKLLLKKKCRCSGNLWIAGVVNQRKAKGPRNWCRLFIRHKHFSRLGKLFHTGSNNTTLVTSPNNGNRPTWATGIVITIHKSKWVSFFWKYITVLWKVYVYRKVMGRGGAPIDKLCERYNLYRQFLVIVCWVCKWGNRCGHQGSVDNDNWHLDRWDLGGETPVNRSRLLLV